MFLHGLGPKTADVQVCWRADLDLESNDRAIDMLAICPPAIGECLPVPIGFLKRWLSGAIPSVSAVADIEGVSEEEKEVRTEKLEDMVRTVVRWRGRDEAQLISSAREVRPGDVIVIPASLGGWDVLGDLPSRGTTLPVLDWGERAHAIARAKAVLRIHPGVISQWPDFPSKKALLDLADSANALFEEDPDVFLVALRGVLVTVVEDETAPGWLNLIVRSLIGEPRLKRGVFLYPSGKGVLIRGTRRLPLNIEESDSFTDEDDSSASGTVMVSLKSHLEGAEKFARRFATVCRLPSDLVEAIASAALLHDLGKADPRFQSLLRGGTPWASAGAELLAKSGDVPQGRSAYLRACKMAGYPVGGRHELLSARLVESAPELFPENTDLRELVLHLVASHHGYCRPFAPVVTEGRPVNVKFWFKGSELSAESCTELERICSGVSERFWRLTRRYGWWGLAWLEAIVRLSDHRRSEAEEIQKENNNG